MRKTRLPILEWDGGSAGGRTGICASARCHTAACCTPGIPARRPPPESRITFDRITMNKLCCHAAATTTGCLQVMTAARPAMMLSGHNPVQAGALQNQMRSVSCTCACTNCVHACVCPMLHSDTSQSSPPGGLADGRRCRHQGCSVALRCPI